MMNKAGHRSGRVALLAGLLASSTPILATDYYVSDCQPGADAQCVAGSDSNNGTSPATPWQTYGRGNTAFKAAAFSAGDRVLFARGGSFAASRADWTNFRCLAGPPCEVGSYTPSWASAAAGRPILTNLTDSVFLFSNGGSSEVDGNYLLRGLELRGGGLGDGIFIFNDVDDLVIDDLKIDGFDVGVKSQGANATWIPPSNGVSDRVVLRNSIIVNNVTQGWIGGSPAGLIENNDFDNNGFGRVNLNHNIYLHNDNTDMVVRNNRLTRSAMVGNLGQEQCQGASLVAHETAQRLIIEGNLVREDVGAAAPGCWGIAIDPGGSKEPEGFVDLVIRGNTVINVGNLSIGVAACQNCVIENNLVINEQTAYWVHGIEVPGGASNPLYGDLTTDNITIRNNSVYISSGSNGNTGIILQEDGGSHIVTGNAIHYAGTAAWDCLWLGLAFSAYEAVDNNLCYSPSASSVEWVGGRGSLTTWRDLTGFDVNSSTANPRFISPAGPDWNLMIAGGSPAVGAGHPTLSSPVDFTGAARDGAPDIGAYELVGPADAMPPARPRNMRVR